MSAMIECNAVSHWYGDSNGDDYRGVLHEMSFAIPRGSFVSVVGSSGCGKTTLLRAISGTHRVRQGQIVIRSQNGAAIDATRPGRDRGVVYQQYSLFPFLTAEENVALGLKFDQSTAIERVLRPLWWRRLKKSHLAQATELLIELNLRHTLRLYPHQMSGGMRQRVALAQALIMKPEILLLDEPFGALDQSSRHDLQRMMRRLHGGPSASSMTVFLITHDLDEALYIGDRVIGLSRDWNWRAQGFIKCPGAKIVYDETTPLGFVDERVEDHRRALEAAIFSGPSHVVRLSA